MYGLYSGAERVSTTRDEANSKKYAALLGEFAYSMESGDDDSEAEDANLLQRNRYSISTKL